MKAEDQLKNNEKITEDNEKLVFSNEKLTLDNQILTKNNEKSKPTERSSLSNAFIEM